MASKLGLVTDAKGREIRYPLEAGVWNLGEDDLLLYGLLTDPVYCAELLGEDPSNREYGGAYKVRDYQYPLFRTVDNYAGFTCARSVGKTESIKWRSVVHVFKRVGENLLLTAPELIHLQPLTDAIEDKLNSIRLTREFLDTRAGKTGFSHRPFGAKFVDGTEIVGRIPRLKGTGVKGQHQPDLMIDEAQDYPSAGWTEVHETVLKDHLDADGKPDFTYHFYGVHSGAMDSGFHARSTKGGFKVVQVTAIQRPGWGPQEKNAAKAAYGGSMAGDYRRNILGEPGGAASPYFVTARLVACMDQDQDSDYNARLVRPGMWLGDGGMHQLIRYEEFQEYGLEIGEMLDLPDVQGPIWGGADLGLGQSPTVITLWVQTKVRKQDRLQLFRRIHLERMTSPQIRQALYAIAYRYGKQLAGFGLDSTGLGLPIHQEMKEDTDAPQHFLDVARGFFFNANVSVGVSPDQVTTDQSGRMRDGYGHAVVLETDPNTGEQRYVIKMPMIEASTRYLREFVDATYMLLPFDPEVIQDMRAETTQRVNRVAGLKSKPNALHILDSMRAMAMSFKSEEVERELGWSNQTPVLDAAL